MKSHEILQ